MFTRFDRIHERDGRTDRQTPHNGIGRACTASRGKNKHSKAYKHAINHMSRQSDEEVVSDVVIDKHNLHCESEKKLDPFSFKLKFRKYFPILLFFHWSRQKLSAY